MRRLLVIGAAVGLFILLVVLAMRSQTLVIEGVPFAQALWNEDQLLVVVQKEEAEMEMSWLRRQLARVSGLFLPLPKRLPATVTLFRIRAEGSNRLDYPRFGLVGGAFPYEGQIYFLRGSDTVDYPLMHQLVNDDLAGVPRDRALQIVSSFDLTSELLAREGWKEHTLYFTEGERTYPIQQGSRQFRLVLTQKHKAGLLKIELIDEERNSEQLLYELSTGWREVSE